VQCNEDYFCLAVLGKEKRLIYKGKLGSSFFIESQATTSSR